MGNGKAKPKEATWKDTNKYPFAIRYQYPLSIRNRCLFFWATTLKGWRATVNFASNLTEGNRICIVYLFGEAKEGTIKNHIAKLGNRNLFVLWAESIPKEKIGDVADGIEAMRIAKKRGVDCGDAEVWEMFDYDYENAIWRITPDTGLLDRARDGAAASQYVKDQILRKGYKNLSNGSVVSAEQNQHMKAIIKIIKDIYPYGAETDTQEEYAYKVLHFEKWCDVGLAGKYDKLDKLGVSYRDDFQEYVQLTLFDNTSWGVKEFVRAFRDICDIELQRNGYFDLRMVTQQMQDPPFGLYQCNYYGLCMGIALRKYLNGYYCSGSLMTWHVEDVQLAVEVKYILGSFDTKRARTRYIYSQSRKQLEFAERFLRLFTEEDIYCMCLQNALAEARTWFTENVRYDTAQRMFPWLFELLDMWEPLVCSNATEKYAEWLTEEKAGEIKEGIKRIDENFLKILEEKHGVEKARLYARSHIVDGGAVGWLHTVETVDKGVEKYMKGTVCRECGTEIHDFNVVYEDDIVHGNHAKLSKRDIIGLNKKILGRYQSEFFCLRCLCEELDCTEWQMYEKMQDFKEQGCTLFQ